MKEDLKTGKWAPAINCKLDERKSRLSAEIQTDVTSTYVPELRRELLNVLEKFRHNSWKNLYLDIRTARMIDSMGVNWIFAEAVRLKEQEKAMVVRISSPALNRVMQFAGLDKVVTIKFRRRKQTR